MIRASLISNINSIAKNMALLQRVDDYLVPESIKAMRDVVNANLYAIVEDIKKGVTERGARKLDIHLQPNSMRAIDYVLYDQMDLTFTDGSKANIMFEPTYDIGVIHQHLLVYIEKNPNKIVNTITTINTDSTYYTYPHQLRIIDTGILEFSNIEFVNLRVAKGEEYAHDKYPEYNWFKTTSSLLLLGQSLDFIIKSVEEITRMYEEIVDKYNRIVELTARAELLAERMEELWLMMVELYEYMLLLVEKAEDAAKRAEDAANRAEKAAESAENAILGAAKVFEITENTTIRKEHRGCWLNCHVPLDTDLIVITIPKNDEEGNAWMNYLEVIVTVEGKGTVEIKAGEGVTLKVMAGCAPIMKNNAKVCSAKKLRDHEWQVYGALEDL